MGSILENIVRTSQIYSTPSSPDQGSATASPAAWRFSELFPPERRVGVEFEFAQLSVGDAVESALKIFPGEATTKTPLSVRIETADGPVRVELDTRVLDKVSAGTAFAARAKRWMGDVAALVIPVEIACPPLPVRDLGRVEALREALRRAGALGTHRSVVYAFGAHLNIEVDPADHQTVLRALRAYLVLEDWLRAEIDVNPARSALGFETRFPHAYERLALDAAYDPDRDAFVRDYLEHNPTRNRGLDLLPVLAHWSPETVEKAVAHEKVSARPAYHYRLPNSEIDAAVWTIGAELDRWAAVEALAADRDLLAQAARARLEALSPPLGGVLNRGALLSASLELGEAVRRAQADGGAS